MKEGGAYELTELGKRVLAKLRELEELDEGCSPLVDYRGLPQHASMSELARDLACQSDTYEVEMLLSELHRKMSRVAHVVSKECLLLVAEVEACNREPSFTCIPADQARLVFKSFVSELYANARYQLCRDLANVHALRTISPLLREYQQRGLIYVKDPAYSVARAQAIAIGLQKGARLANVVAHLMPATLELIVVCEEVSAEELKLLDGLVEPGRLTIVSTSADPSLPPLRRIGVVIHGLDAWRESGALLELVNTPTALLFSRGSRVPSITLAELPLPEPGEAYLLTLRLAAPLPVLYSGMKHGKLDVFQFLSQVVEEAEKVAGRLRASHAQRALKGFAKRVEVVKPQLALTGLEVALRLHHSALEAPRFAELSRRFWSTLVEEFREVDIVAAMADERLYAFSKPRTFSPLSSCDLTVSRPLEEVATLEGIAQSVLGGGSTLALRVGGYLSPEQLTKVVRVMEASGVMRFSFHLEFTSCESCLSTSVGWKGICDLCLSDNVVHLARPLDLYSPLDATAREVAEEYSRRSVLLAGVSARR